MKVSIVIGTCGMEHGLARCIESIRDNTNMTDKEILVVANGADEETKDFLVGLKPELKSIWYDERLGYPSAYNRGIEATSGEIVILLNDDTVVLDRSWMEDLLTPFKDDPSVGITGPMKFSWDCGGTYREAIAFWCASVRREVFDTIGLLDEAFSPGMGEDGDFCIRAQAAGFKLVQVPEDGIDDFGSKSRNLHFMLFHKGNGTFGEDNESKEASILKNNKILRERYGRKGLKISVIIPTYQHFLDCLKPCIETIEKYSDMSKIELVVVANGCTDGTKDYLIGRHYLNLKTLFYPEAIGYTKALNAGIKAATGDFLVFLNNDTELLPQEEDAWLDMLLAPFLMDPTVGITGPLMLHDNYADVETLIFFCVMVSRKLVDTIGLPDEIYSPGGGEDIDYCARAQMAGFKTLRVPVGGKMDFTYTNIGDFPIWHKDNRTFGEIPEYTNFIVKRNGLINAKRYNRNIRLNLGSGGVHEPGYLSVDLNDKRTHILMDATKLDFDDCSVTEILASHLFEHISPYRATDTLKEWLRVLRPGGRLVMEMPDIERLCEAMLNATKAERYGFLNCVYGAVNTTAEGENSDITAPHLWGWFRDHLSDHLTWAGFTEIIFMDEQFPHPGFNFRVEAVKPESVNFLDFLKTQDPLTFKEVFEVNSYGLLREEVEGKRVLDIGANIGLFAVLCILNGAKEVISVEPVPAIYQALKSNTAHFTGIGTLNFAVWNEEGKAVRILDENVASRIRDDGDVEALTVTLRQLIDAMPDGEDLVLKLDCEGAEYQIIINSYDEDMFRFSTVYMELHWEVNEDPKYRGKGPMMERMEGLGFDCVLSEQMNDGHGNLLPVEVLKFVRL